MWANYKLLILKIINKYTIFNKSKSIQCNIHIQLKINNNYLLIFN